MGEIPPIDPSCLKKPWAPLLIKVRNGIAYRTPLGRYFFAYFRYHMIAVQLCLPRAWLEKTRNVPGGVLEVGCSTGMTTVFLNKYMDAGSRRDTSQSIPAPGSWAKTFSTKCVAVASAPRLILDSGPPSRNGSTRRSA